MSQIRKWLNILNESLSDWNTGKWIHYSDSEMMTINLSPYHQDPLAIYAFPEKFPPYTNMWLNKKYKFTITLKPNTHILDLDSITENQIKMLLDATGATKYYENSILHYPPKDHKDIVKRFWDAMRNAMVLNSKKSASGGKAKWNKIIREMGYDAIFDDTGAIYSAEVQLVILDPRIIATINRQPTKINVFHEMQKIVGDLKNILMPYGEVTVEGPMKMKNGWGSSADKILMAKVEVKKSEENYAMFKVTYDHLDRSRRDSIQISLSYSRPSLDYGTGATYDLHKHEYQKYGGLDKLQSDLEIIFSDQSATE